MRASKGNPIIFYKHNKSFTLLILQMKFLKQDFKAIYLNTNPNKPILHLNTSRPTLSTWLNPAILIQYSKETPYN